MKKIAFIFPGQGSQYVGMGKDFYETFPCAKEMIDLAAGDPGKAQGGNLGAAGISSLRSEEHTSELQSQR